MYINIDGTVYSMSFVYYHIPAVAWDQSKKTFVATNPKTAIDSADWKEGRGEDGTKRWIKTECFIERKSEEEWIPVANDYAICSMVDRFLPSIGRKIALSRALLNGISNRNLRRALWLLYFENHRDGKKFTDQVKRFIQKTSNGHQDLVR
jgi:hypothetical protein